MQGTPTRPAFTGSPIACRTSANLRDWSTRHEVGFEIIHTSGHAVASDLKRLVSTLHPKTVIPIHTIAADEFQSFGRPVVSLTNGQWFEL